jgi:3-hydroxybutyryl-CoA dehydrogenase
MVVGAGTMGAGIAQVAAAAGERVLLFDADPKVPDAALRRMSLSLERAQRKGLVTEDAARQTLNNIYPVAALEESRSVPFVIEAIKEELAAKKQLFFKLETLVPPETILLSNTSMLSISTLATGLEHPDRFAGTHFFNPVPRMKLVEVIGGRRTSPATLEAATAMVERWGKTPVHAPDSPGFIVNRVFDALKRESLALLEEGVPASEIDQALRLGLNFPMGPFELMDLIGLDTTYDCLCNQARQMDRKPDFGGKLPALVEAGLLGRKTGSGFYKYD